MNADLGHVVLVVVLVVVVGVILGVACLMHGAVPALPSPAPPTPTPMWPPLP